MPEGAVVTVRYRTGVGQVGNRGPGEVDGLGGADPAVVATFNPLAVSGGVDAEPPDVSKARAGAGVHALDRAVSAADVRSLALSFGGVARAAVLRDPVRRRERMAVVVLGEGGRPLTDADRSRLRAHLTARMPPGSSVTVEDATPVGVSVALTVRVAPGRDPLAVVREARSRLGADPPPPGRPPGLLAPGRPDLGEDVHLSDVFAALAGIPDLVSVAVHALHRAAEPPARHDRVEVPPTSVPVWAAAPGADAVAVAWEEAVDR